MNQETLDDLKLYDSLQANRQEQVLVEFIEYLRHKQRLNGSGLMRLYEAVELGVLTRELARSIEQSVFYCNQEYKLTNII